MLGREQLLGYRISTVQKSPPGPSVQGPPYHCFLGLGEICEKDGLTEKWLFLQAQEDLSLRHAL